MMTIDQNAVNLLQRELALAGFSAEDEQRLNELEACRITPDKELPPVEFLFRVHDKPCFARGELTGLSGKAKSGKTFVCSILMALCFRNEVLSVTRIEPRKLHVLWYDTEQSDESTKDILCQRICQMTGIQQNQFPSDQFDVFNVRQKPVNERLPALEVAVRYRHPDLVILDGVRDLVDDINNGQLAHEVTERLMKIAQQARCCIVCVIHQNKAAEDRTLRGSIGTELTNKAFEVYECEKLMPSRTFVMTQKLTRKYDIVDSLYFTVDDRGLPQQVGAPQAGLEMTVITADGIARQTGLKAKYLIVHEDGSWEVDYRLLFRDALTNQGELCGGELRDRVMGLCGMKNRFQYGELLEKAKAGGILSMRKAGKKHYYWLAPD